jgi:hypothetical protein
MARPCTARSTGSSVKSPLARAYDHSISGFKKCKNFCTFCNRRKGPPCDRVVDHRLGRRVISESKADSAGHDALRIIIVLKSGSADRITGENAQDALIRTHAALQQANEKRLPIVEYATEEELEASDDIES